MNPTTTNFLTITPVVILNEINSYLTIPETMALGSTAHSIHILLNQCSHWIKQDQIFHTIFKPRGKQTKAHVCLTPYDCCSRFFTRAHRSFQLLPATHSPTLLSKLEVDSWFLALAGRTGMLAVKTTPEGIKQFQKWEKILESQSLCVAILNPLEPPFRVLDPELPTPHRARLHLSPALAVAIAIIALFAGLITLKRV